MIDDPRIKRVLKRYPKGVNFFDASMDVSALGISLLLQACSCAAEESLDKPRELDKQALDHFASCLKIEFDEGRFDYFLHSYVRSEFVPSYFEDASVTSKPAPETGPPAKIPIPPGMRWRSVRPKNGEEAYEAWEYIEDAAGA